MNTTTGRALHNMHVEQRNGDYVCVRGGKLNTMTDQASVHSAFIHTQLHHSSVVRASLASSEGPGGHSQLFLFKLFFRLHVSLDQ